MPKMIAPHGASFRGRALNAGEILDVSDREASELAAHGFTLFEPLLVGNKAGDLAGLSRKALLQRLKGKGHGNLFVLSTDELRALVRT